MSRLELGTYCQYIFYRNHYYGVSLGSSCFLVLLIADSFLIFLPSGKLKLFKENAICLFDNTDYSIRKLAKKGVKVLYKKHKKPIVRGTVKNPVDHPNGGRTRNRPLYMTPWGHTVLKKK